MAADSASLDLETHYQQLLDLLESPVSDRWGLVQVAGFLARLDLGHPETESYLLPLAEPIAAAVEELDPVGLSPGQLADLVAALRTARTHHSALRPLDAAETAEHGLRRRAALLYAYAGAAGRVVSCLAPDAERPFDEAALSASGPRARLNAVRSRTDQSALDRDLQWIEARWDRAGDDPHTTYLPVVERLPSWVRSGGIENGRVGALRTVGVELFGPSDTIDRLQVDVIVHGADEVDVTAVPLTAARRLLDERHPRLEGRHVQGRLAFDRRHLEHGGRSAGLAIAALFYGAVLDHTQRRRRQQLRPSVALTGAVTAEGAVEAVEAEALPTKVRTAFFSPTERLVVPEAQRADAEATREVLLDEFPHGTLDLVGVDRFDAVFYDRRLTEQRRIGWVRHAAQRLWHRRGRVVAWTVIAALLLVIAALLYGPLDKNPVAVDFSGEEMILKNESGRVVERIAVGEGTVQSAKNGGYNAYRLGDIDGNQQNEVCWAGPKLGRPDSQEHLQCKGVGEDTVRWARAMRFEVSFPRKPAVKAEDFSANYVRIGDFDASGRPEVIVTASHRPYFPFLVLKFDATTGRVRQRYLHAGYLNEPPMVADLNGDGVREILLTGVSNAYDQAVFTVLDARRMQGHGPVRGDYVVGDMSPAQEIVYMRFPPTVVDRAQPQAENGGRNVNYYGDRDLIKVEIYDGRLPGRNERSSFILVHLNKQFEPVAVGTSSQYDRLASWLVKQGKLEQIPDYDYFQQYKQGFRYWTGSGWTREPTINARWDDMKKTVWRPDTLGNG